MGTGLPLAVSISPIRAEEAEALGCITRSTGEEFTPPVRVMGNVRDW